MLVRKRVLNLCSDAMQHYAELRQFLRIPAVRTLCSTATVSTIVSTTYGFLRYAFATRRSGVRASCRPPACALIAGAGCPPKAASLMQPPVGESFGWRANLRLSILAGLRASQMLRHLRAIDEVETETQLTGPCHQA
jgi:hypothetical protein